jgi:hypothetical protein
LETPVPLPCTLTAYAPVATVAATAIEIAEVAPVALVGLKDTTIPAGAPVLVRATAPVKPPARAMFAVDVPDCPCSMLTAAGVTVSANPGAAVIVSCTVAVCALTPVPVPRSVSVDVPTAAFAAAVIVIDPVDTPAPMDRALAVTPVGSPSTATATAPVNPPVRVIVRLSVPVPAVARESDAPLSGTMVLWAAPPAWTESVVGATARVNACVSVGPPSSPPQAVMSVELARAIAMA